MGGLDAVDLLVAGVLVLGAIPVMVAAVLDVTALVEQWKRRPR